MSGEIDPRLTSTTTTTEGAVNHEGQSSEGRDGSFDHRWTGLLDKEEIARAGFTYIGPGDKVECSECGLRLLNWTASDDPLHQHASRRPLCPFITRTYTQLDRVKPPKHPQYQLIKDRLDSFVAWPGRYVPKTPEELAASGFYYIGSADRVTCFQCGITLRDWEQDHDPVEEHRRYSPNCDFINRPDVNQLGVETRNTCTESRKRETEANRLTSSRGNGIKEKDEIGNTDGACASPGTTNSISNGQKQNTSTMSLIAPFENTLTISNDVTNSGLDGDVDDNDDSRVETSRGGAAEENRRLRERGTCRVCRKERVSTLFLPCGHLVTCSSCSPSVHVCLVCGKNILGTVKTFFA